MKREVIETMENLQKNPSDESLRNLLRLTKLMLQVSEIDRPDANIVRENLAYIAIKSLFRAAMQEMIHWGERSRQKGPPDRAREVCEDAWKLRSWDHEVGIHKANPREGNDKYKNAISSNIETEEQIQTILHDLLKWLRREGDHDTRDFPRRDLNNESSVQQRDEMRDNVNRCIRDLRRALPGSFGEKIQKRKGDYWPCLAENPPRLPDMPTEVLQSSPRFLPQATASFSEPSPGSAPNTVQKATYDNSQPPLHSKLPKGFQDALNAQLVDPRYPPVGATKRLNRSEDSSLRRQPVEHANTSPRLEHRMSIMQGDRRATIDYEENDSKRTTPMSISHTSPQSVPGSTAPTTPGSHDFINAPRFPNAQSKDVESSPSSINIPPPGISDPIFHPDHNAVVTTKEINAIL